MSLKSNTKSSSANENNDNTNPSTEKLVLTDQTQGQDIEVIPLEIENAAHRISRSSGKDLQFGQNLRWIRDTEPNREVLFDYLIKRIIIKKILSSVNWSYLPCCNIFCRSKPTGSGHHGARWNPFLFLLNEKETSKVLTFKKKLRQKNRSLSLTNFKYVARPEIFKFIKAELELKKLHELIEELPRKCGCFHLPLAIQQDKDECPGPSPLLAKGAKLDFKVDLVSIEVDQVNANLVSEQIKSSGKRKKPQNKTKELSSFTKPVSSTKGEALPNTVPDSHQAASFFQPEVLPIMTKSESLNQFYRTGHSLNSGNFGYTHQINQGLGLNSAFGQGGAISTLTGRNHLEEEDISVYNQDPEIKKLGNSFSQGVKDFSELSGEELQERIVKLNILKHHQELIIKKKRGELSSLKLKFNAENEELVRIEDAALRIKTTN